MKKYLIVALMALVVVAAGCTKGYQSQKSAGDVQVILNAKSYPLVQGNNAMNVKIADASGKPLSDAKVDVRYYMPPMPGMAPMEYTAQTTPQGGDYAFTANIPMEGGWKVDVTVTQPGKPGQTVIFNVDAR